MTKTPNRARTWNRRWRASLCAIVAPILALGMSDASAQTALPSGFVYLRDVDPSIAQDIRYAGSDNFVGRPLAGYDAAECILRRDVAAALKRVQSELRASNLSLKVYDCYRPERAVRTMMQWARDTRSGNATKRFFPKLEKTSLFAGYLAARSRHSTGTAVDLTLIEGQPRPVPAFNPATAYAPCTGGAAERSPDNSIDMGTGYDCFDTRSHTASPAITAEQRRWRTLLVAVMARQGFKNYHREWWHYAYAGGGPLGYYDSPIRPRSKSD